MKYYNRKEGYRPKLYHLHQRGKEMKKYCILLLTAVLAIFANQMIASCPVYAEDKILNIDEVIRNVDPEKVNKAQFKEYFRDIDGQTVKGAGIVVNILPGSRGTNRVAILTPASNPDKGYNVMLYTTQDVSAEIKKDDRILFEGKITRVNPYQGASIDLHGAYQKAGAK
jgi:hypothetical protein